MEEIKNFCYRHPFGCVAGIGFLIFDPAAFVPFLITYTIVWNIFQFITKP